MNELFYNINLKDQIKLLKLFEAYTRTYTKNSYISINTRENIIGVLLKGRLSIIKTDYNGNQKIVEELNDNNIFGTTISYLSNDEYSVLVKENSRILFIDYESALILNNNTTYYNRFLKNLLDILIKLIDEKNKHIEILSKKTIRDKLLEYFKIASNHKRIIYLPFSYTLLADYLAVDRTAMSRELKNLKDEGFILTKGRIITLLYYK